MEKKDKKMCIRQTMSVLSYPIKPLGWEYMGSAESKRTELWKKDKNNKQ